MDVEVDVVTGAAVPKYTREILSRLPPSIRARPIPSRGYGSTRIATAYRLFHHPREIRRLRRKEAILHVDTQLLAYVLAKSVKPPTLLTCHDLVPFHPEFDDPSYVSRRRAVDRIFYRRLNAGLLRANRIVAVSDFTRKELIGRGVRADTIDVVPMGVDLDAYRPRPEAETKTVLAKYGIPADRPRLLYVGTEHPRKNLAGLFRAFARLQGRTDAVLVKVGSPRAPQHAELERLASSLGITARVVSVESVAEPDMPALYAAAHALVLPSFYEGFGLPPLEAMACGTPVAVSRAASLPELVGEAGMYFDPRDEEDLADALLRILGSEDLRADLARRGRERARAYGWERTIEALVRSYERLAGRENRVSRTKNREGMRDHS